MKRVALLLTLLVLLVLSMTPMMSDVELTVYEDPETLNLVVLVTEAFVVLVTMTIYHIGKPPPSFGFSSYQGRTAVHDDTTPKTSKSLRILSVLYDSERLTARPLRLICI